MSNRLAQETSPYLLQHQHNPVDWYPWGEEAFAAARAQNKPIFLSVGYSTCYWCHVMERQSFENEAVAAEMNQRFINIKVDREERPDVDQLYMIAVQVLTRHGGWPMSVFLTPDLRPFYGGTYFPPQDMHGRPGFVSVLRGIEDAYRNRPADVEQTANQIVNILRDLSEPEGAARPITIDSTTIEKLIDRSTNDYDPTFAGFGGAPKFPRETLLELLLKSEISDSKSQLQHTLASMARGGIRDHLGGGFHRYSTDAHWLVPHFEIMLYDNAMLGWCYAEAFAQWHDPFYEQIARELFDFVLREMTSPDGAFYTAFDAEVDAQEGLSYLWTADEIEESLGEEDAKLFAKVYGIDQGPNFADPHHGHGAPDKNILFLADPDLYTKNRDRIDTMRAKLKAIRDQRKQPLLDTKIITSWNALMIRALAHAGKVFNEPRYTHAAATAAGRLLETHRMPDGGLYRASRDGKPKYNAFLDDYAFFAQALLALDRRDDATQIATEMLTRFADDKGGLFFSDKNATDLVVRQKTASDSPLPSGNAVAAMLLLDLDNKDEALRILKPFAPQLERQAEGMSSMVQSAAEYVRRHGPIDVPATADASRAERIAPPEQIAAGVVGLRATMRTPTTMDVRVEILDGFHINAHDAAKDFIATSLAVTGGQLKKIDYPPGEERRFAFADSTLRVYEGSITIAVEFTQPPTGKLTLNLTYQACDDSTCLPPVTKRFEVVVRN